MAHVSRISGGIRHHHGAAKKITIRIGADLLEHLVTERTAISISISEVIRETLQERIMGRENLTMVREELERMRREMRKVRQELALATDVILSFGGHLAREDAREWVIKNLCRE